MYTNPKNRLNAFKEVAIPSNTQYFSRFGQMVADGSLYQDDNEDLPSGTKIQLMSHYMHINEVRLRDEEKNSSDD